MCFRQKALGVTGLNKKKKLVIERLKQLLLNLVIAKSCYFSVSHRSTSPKLAISYDHHCHDMLTSRAKFDRGLRWPNTVFDPGVSFTFFSKSLDLFITKYGRKQAKKGN